VTRNHSFSDRFGPGRDGRNAESQPVDPWALAIGGLIVALAVSSLIDDRTTLDHPWWSVLLGAAVAACAFVVTRTARRFFAVDGEGSTDRTQ
jgi:hypothetical protein